MRKPSSRSRVILITTASAVVIALAAVFLSFRGRPVVLELALYSGNSWGVPQNFAYAVFDRAVDMFEERYADKGYRVVLRTGTMYKDYSEWFAQLVLKGREPDIFLILEEDFNTYAAIGLLQKLDEYIVLSDFDTNSFFRNALEAGQSQGSQYSLPIGIVPSFLIVNNTLLDSLGLSIDRENWTWDEFYRICAAITADLDNDGAPDRFGVEGFDWHHAFYTNDEKLFTPDNTQAAFNDKRMEELLLFLKSLYTLNQGVVVREGMFENGQVGFKTFNLSQFRVYGSYPYRILRFDQFEWEALPFPHGPHGMSESKLYSVQMGMSSRSRNKEAAFEFLKFISNNEEFQYEIWEYSNMLPVNRNVFDLIYRSGVMQRDGMRTLDRRFIESVVANSYIDPDFKKYPVIDRYITQRIFTIIAQDEDIQHGVPALRELINELLEAESSIRISGR